MHPDIAVEERRLKSKHPAIWKSIFELGLSYVFNNLGYINVSLVCEFYARWDPEDEDQLVPLRGRLIDISVSSLFSHFGAPDIPHDPLRNFIARPTYQEIRCTLCNFSFTAAWIRDKGTGGEIVVAIDKF